MSSTIIPLEMANKGVNEFVANTVAESSYNTFSVLVLGSGAGIMEKLLSDRHFITVCSADYSPKPLTIPSNSFVRVDFNKTNFSSVIRKKFKHGFDIIIAIEVVEHLYSTQRFLRNIKKLLNTNGKIFLSTPNVHSAMARAENILTGYPSWYYARPRVGDHVSPQYDRITQHLAKVERLEVKEVLYYGSMTKYLLTYPKYTWKSWAYSIGLIVIIPVLFPLMLVDRKSLFGVNKIYVISGE